MTYSVQYCPRTVMHDFGWDRTSGRCKVKSMMEDNMDLEQVWRKFSQLLCQLILFCLDKWVFHVPSKLPEENSEEWGDTGSPGQHWSCGRQWRSQQWPIRSDRGAAVKPLLPRHARQETDQHAGPRLPSLNQSNKSTVVNLMRQNNPALLSPLPGCQPQLSPGTSSCVPPHEN